MDTAKLKWAANGLVEIFTSYKVIEPDLTQARSILMLCSK